MKVAVWVFCLLALMVGDDSIAQSEAPRTLPGSVADTLLQRDATRILILADMAAYSSCRQERVILWADVIEPPKGKRFPGGGLRTGGWTERWQLWRCGKMVPYLVKFMTDGKGGTFIKVSVIVEK
ncbi:MAG: hypothetical protein HYW15_02835 [Candidatus Giovannonibacteria bacterium]|nr:MAG: hypothetical protein HYW15_02835 [Candidatus Giovannonibacteria bacterium]